MDPDTVARESGHVEGSRSEGAVKVVGRRRPSRGGLVAAAPFLELVIRLRGDKPFIPRGVHRFQTFEESQAWSLRMMARPGTPGPRDCRTSSPSAGA